MPNPASQPSVPLALEQTYAHTRVSAQTPFSCFLAGIESLMRDRVGAATQADMLSRYAAVFPRWAAQPGYIHDTGEAECILKLVGILDPVAYVRNSAEVVSRFNPTKGGFIFTKRFYDQDGKVSDLNHALRLLAAEPSGLIVMNPYRAPSLGAFEPYSWLQFADWDALVALLE